ncbi:MAG: Crp/Fnr family transcriptional regulator [Bradyrhizobium sp.]|nr:Crp/Fnr family transcriptional regulator [Betaproteobacteria bacterium]MDE2004164.1 Crp/Fnr family transcriptional regulator [Betaproteobacteria bacterium]MDE2469549.1 Crp/Fnr family transcriptional regulator [Bradyrhizobium sp.]
MLVSPKQNHLLAALDTTDYAWLAPHLERVHLPLRAVVFGADMHARHAYFPTTSVLSLLYDLESGSSVEISVTGNDGVVGMSLLLGGDTPMGRAVVRSAGYAYRISVDVLAKAFESRGLLRHLLLRYTQALITQIAHTAVCNEHHRIEQRLCRSLLSYLDRLATNALTMTHESLASMLGVRRESVTAAATKLQDAGLIRYSRGRIEVLDRPGLEQQVCECYAAVKAEFGRLLPQRKPATSAAVFVARSYATRSAFPAPKHRGAGQAVGS